MAVQVERLVATLEARLDKYEKSLTKARRLSNKEFTKIEKRGARMEKKLASLGVGAFRGFTSAAVAALAPILSIGAALNKARDAMDDFDKIAKTARNTGLSTDFYQSFAYQAELAGVSIGEVNSALTSFIRTSGRGAAGFGEMAENLRRLDPELLKNIQLSTSQEQRLRIMADAISKANSSTQKAALAAAAFGDAGVKLVQVLDQGADGFDRTAVEAKRLGLIINEELLNRAEALKDEFSTASKIIDLEFKQAFIDLAPFLISSAQLMGSVAHTISILGDQIRDIDSRIQVQPLQNLLAGIQNDRIELGEEIARYEQMIENLGKSNPSSASISFQLPEMRMRYEELTAEADKLLSRITELQGRGRKPIELPDVPTLPESDKQRSSRQQAAEQALREAEAVKALIDNLKFERSLIGLSAVEQQRLTAIRRAGAAATDEQRTEIEQLITATYEETRQAEQLENAYAEMGAAGTDAIRGIINAFQDGKIEGSELLDIVGQIGSRLFEFGLSSITSPGGFLGGLFGRRADGGPVVAGRGYQVAERNKPEIFFPQGSGHIMPLPTFGGGSGYTDQRVFHVDARGAQQGVGEEIVAALQHYDRQVLPESMQRIQSDPRLR